MATPQELLTAGDPAQALAALQNQVREKPGDAKLRVFLFQLLSVLGQWERAMAQLEVCGQLDHGTLAMVQTYREAIKCEAVRGAVFAGKTTPVVFGQPAEWVALLVQALSHDAQGHPEQAQQLRAQAFDAAPATAGSLNGEAFDWIADADSRLGPVLEVVLNGRYTWLPFNALSAITVEAPVDLRDMVWTPVHLTFTNGGDTVALVPTCYPGTREQPDGKLKLARATEWLPCGPEQYAGLGQRILSTSSAELGVLEARDIKLKV
ncbi:MAG: tetratricopeptide repeat protein [Cytophagales bacterium]|nr:tetratricopeptide repeat protein [Rhizobacter sp.]